MSLEAQNDLKQFLKVVRPDWSCPKKRSRNDCTRVLQKLQAIGINDTAELLDRVTKNTINEELSEAGYARFSRDTLQAIRKQGAFYQSLEHLKEPSYRQIGLFAPVPQMLAGKNLRNQVLKSSNANTGSLLPITGRTPELHSRNTSARSRPHTVAPHTAAGAAGSTPEAVSATSSSPRLRPSTVTGNSGPSGVATPHTISSIGCGSSSFTVLPRLRGVPYSRRGSRRARPSTSASAPQLSTDGVESDIATSSGYPSRRRDSGNSSMWGGSSTGMLREQPVRKGSLNKQLTEEQQLERDVDRWNRTGHYMSSKRDPQWSSLPSQLLEHGEAMIQEQEALKAKKKLYQEMRQEGEVSPMRKHVARKIRTRMREEYVNNPQVALDVQQTCMSIRKNIEAMMKTRRLLATVNTEAKNVVEPQKEGKRLVGLSLDLFKKQKSIALDSFDLSETLGSSMEESPLEDTP